MNEALLSFCLLSASVLVILILHAYLVVCEVSLVKIRYREIEDDELERLRQEAAIARLIDTGDQAGRVVHVAKTLCVIGLGIFWVPLVHSFREMVHAEAVLHGWLSMLLSFCFAVVAYFLFAEILPLGIAMKDPAKGLRRSFRVLYLFQILTFPIRWLFRRFKHGLFGHLGVETGDVNPLDVDVQIRALGEDSIRLSPLVREIVDRAMQMNTLVVQDILLPRNQVIVYDLEEASQASLDRMKSSGHTRFPLCRGNLDDCVGIIHIKDIFHWKGREQEADLLEMKRNVAVFEWKTSLAEVLKRMLRGKFHMALVSDAFGGISGVITLESILEKLVGEIQDEFDSEEDRIVSLDEADTFRISGLASIHEIEERLKIEIDSDGVSTLGGLITGELGRLPERGERFSISGMDIEVAEVDDRRILSVCVRCCPA